MVSVLKNGSGIKSVYVATGFGKHEERRGDDIALSAKILFSSDCKSYWSVPAKNHDGNFIFKSDPNAPLTKPVWCVRFQVFKGQSDWLRVRLFHIRSYSS